MSVPLNIQGTAADIVRDVARKVLLRDYDLEFEDRGGVHFVVLVLKDGSKVYQELRTGWPELLQQSLITLRDTDKVQEVKEQPLSVAVIHKPTGKWTASEVMRKDVRNYSGAIISAFSKTETATPADFVLVEVDWSSKRLNITKLE